VSVYWDAFAILNESVYGGEPNHRHDEGEGMVHGKFWFFSLLLFVGCSEPLKSIDPDKDDSGDTDDEFEAPLRVDAGTLAFFDADACPGGWSEWTEARGRAVVAVSEPNDVGVTVGEALSDNSNPLHTHGVSGEFDVSGAGIAGLSSCCNGNPGQAGRYTLSTDLEESSGDLPTLTLLPCVRDDEGLDASGAPVVAGMAAYFVRDACPSGWSPLTEANGRLVTGLPSGAVPLQTVGEALSSGEERSHQHSVEATLVVPEHSIAGAGGGNNDHSAKGTYDFTALSEVGQGGLPYVQALMCEADRTPEATDLGDQEMPPGAILHTTDLGCPDGWVEHSPSKGRFLMGVSAGGVPGVTDGEPLEAGEERLHSHTMTASVNIPSKDIALVSGCCFSGMGAAGTYAVSGLIEPASSGMPYISLRTCEKK